jgi:hypothetical protein
LLLLAIFLAFASTHKQKHSICKQKLEKLLAKANATSLLISANKCEQSLTRPLCPASNDPNDLLVLTPGHFLVGEPLMAPVEPNLSPLPKNRLSRWQYTEQIRQHFWTRWRKEYLTSLQQRSKWNRPPATIQPGSMVLINEDNLPPQQWLLGRIIQLLTRVVSIKTTSGILKRAVNRISILPMDNDNEEASDKEVL